MRVFACIAWFDESPRWLAETVASCAKIADHVVAVDGAFFHYPEGRPSSGGDQAEIVHSVAVANGMGCTVMTPQQVWMGNEVEKRTAYARLVNALATPGEDWMLVLDADEVITYVSGLARQDLEEATSHAATVAFWTTDEMRSWYGTVRRLYRVLPNMVYGPSHFTLAGDLDGRRVFLNGRGAEWGEQLEPEFDMTSQIKVEHKAHMRPEARTERADEFDRRRVDYELEPWVRP